MKKMFLLVLLAVLLACGGIWFYTDRYFLSSSNTGPAVVIPADAIPHGQGLPLRTPKEVQQR